MDLVTGATGFLGSYIAERLVQADRSVRASVRASSNTAFLESLGVERMLGDLSDPNSCEQLCDGVEWVFHSAAKVGDWGPWDAFERDTIQATENLARAALKKGAKRFVHISSISAYGHPNGKGLVLDETAPLGYNVNRWSYYTRAKVAAERVLWKMHKEEGLPLTVIRPSWIYGPRDRTSIARLHRMITTGRIKILGRGDNRLNTVYVGNIADACLLAAQKDVAIGQGYNISNDGEITQLEYLSRFAESFGAPRPKRHVPYQVAIQAGFLCEVIGRALRSKKPPMITRYSVWLLGRDVFFSTAKAREQLGWKSRVSYDEGIGKTAAWYLETLK